MSSATLYRWSGFVLLAGSIIGLLGTILRHRALPQPRSDSSASIE